MEVDNDLIGKVKETASGLGISEEGLVDKAKEFLHLGGNEDHSQAVVEQETKDETPESETEDEEADDDSEEETEEDSEDDN